MTADGHEVSFGNVENVLKSASGDFTVLQISEKPPHCTLWSGQSLVCELFFSTT